MMSISQGSGFRPYNFVLWGTVYAWSSSYGTARDSCTVILDTLAQMLAIVSFWRACVNRLRASNRVDSGSRS